MRDSKELTEFLQKAGPEELRLKLMPKVVSDDPKPKPKALPKDSLIFKAAKMKDEKQVALILEKMRALEPDGKKIAPYLKRTFEYLAKKTSKGDPWDDACSAHLLDFMLKSDKMREEHESVFVKRASDIGNTRLDLLIERIVQARDRYQLTLKVLGEFFNADTRAPSDDFYRKKHYALGVIFCVLQEGEPLSPAKKMNCYARSMKLDGDFSHCKTLEEFWTATRDQFSEGCFDGVRNWLRHALASSPHKSMQVELAQISYYSWLSSKRKMAEDDLSWFCSIIYDIQQLFDQGGLLEGVYFESLKTMDEHLVALLEHKPPFSKYNRNELKRTRLKLAFVLAGFSTKEEKAQSPQLTEDSNRTITQLFKTLDEVFECKSNDSKTVMAGASEHKVNVTENGGGVQLATEEILFHMVKKFPQGMADALNNKFSASENALMRRPYLREGTAHYVMTEKHCANLRSRLKRETIMNMAIFCLQHLPDFTQWGINSAMLPSVKFTDVCFSGPHDQRQMYGGWYRYWFTILEENLKPQEELSRQILFVLLKEAAANRQEKFIGLRQVLQIFKQFYTAPLLLEAFDTDCSFREIQECWPLIREKTEDCNEMTPKYLDNLLAFFNLSFQSFSPTDGRTTIFAFLRTQTLDKKIFSLLSDKEIEQFLSRCCDHYADIPPKTRASLYQLLMADSAKLMKSNAGILRRYLVLRKSKQEIIEGGFCEVKLDITDDPPKPSLEHKEETGKSLSEFIEVANADELSPDSNPDSPAGSAPATPKATNEASALRLAAPPAPRLSGLAGPAVTDLFHRLSDAPANKTGAEIAEPGITIDNPVLGGN